MMINFVQYLPAIIEVILAGVVGLIIKKFNSSTTNLFNNVDLTSKALNTVKSNINEYKNLCDKKVESIVLEVESYKDQLKQACDLLNKANETLEKNNKQFEETKELVLKLENDIIELKALARKED